METKAEYQIWDTIVNSAKTKFDYKHIRAMFKKEDDEITDKFLFHIIAGFALAEREGQILGWVSGYRPPSDPDVFFVWQVAVSSEARGQRLAGRMIAALLDRPQARGVTHLITTVTADNRSSRAMFEGLARTWATRLVEEPLFDRETHFAGAHATEWQLRIGPIPASGLAQARNHADQEV